VKGITEQEMEKNGWLWTINKIMSLVLNPLIKTSNNHDLRLKQDAMVLDSLNKRLAKLEGIKI